MSTKEAILLWVTAFLTGAALVWCAGLSGKIDALRMRWDKDDALMRRAVRRLEKKLTRMADALCDDEEE